MPRLATSEEPSTSDPVRVCAACSRAKTIRGVWYLVHGRAAASPFMCEACFSMRPVSASV